jgi:DNA-binding NarL/FixJ family response regulator
VSDPAPAPGLSVLLVDDDADLRSLLRRRFEAAGMDDVAEAADGQEALDVAATQSPDLIVLDLAMPVRSGVEVLPDLRRTAPGARIVVLSSFPQRRLQGVVRARGAVGYVQKDTGLDVLVEQILLTAALTETAVEHIASSRFDRDHGAARAARRFVRSVVAEADVETIAAVELLVSELVTNAVLHAASEPQVDVHLSKQRLRVEVYDDDPALPHRRTPDAVGPGGRGLLLLEQFADRWGAEPRDDGKVVWFEIDRS